MFHRSVSGQSRATYAVKHLNAKSVVIIQDVSADYSVGLATFFKRSFIELTGNPKVCFLSIPINGGPGFHRTAYNARALNPDVIFILVILENRADCQAGKRLV